MPSRAARGQALSLLFSTLLLGRAIAVRGHTEVRVELQMDRWAARGGSVRLRCSHDVPPHLLDKVVFLRHGTKIFQYIKNRKPPYRNFTTPGAVLNIALATENSIVLQNLELAASGGYSCEVSLDTPIYTKASAEKQLTVIQPQKHQPTIQFPRQRLMSGDTLRANCTSAPALPAPHITWIVNGDKVDESMVHSHKFPVSPSDRWGMRRTHQHQDPDRWDSRRNRVTEVEIRDLENRLELESTVTANLDDPRRPNEVTPLEFPPGCSFYDLQLAERSSGAPAARAPSRHRARRPGRDLFVTVSELQLTATGRLHIVCVSTIPEFRSIHDTFADVRNDTVVVDVIKPSTLTQPSENMTLGTAEPASAGAGRAGRGSLLGLAAAAAAVALLRPPV